MAEKGSSSSDSGRRKAIVVGAGVGGTATAARLAHAGFDVEVYEKNSFSGGRCSLIHHDGYRFDQGPSLLLLPPLFRALYADLGTTLESHIDLIKCDPNYIVHYHDGESVVLTTDRARMRAEVERFEGPEGAEGLEGFLRESGKHAELSYSLVLSKTFPSLFSLLRPSFLVNAIALHPLESLWSRACIYFKTERMRRAFTFGSMYLGSSPFDAPGTYSLLQWTEAVEGIWYPRGGFHRVVDSLVRIAETHGAAFHYDAPVSHVSIDEASGRATGIVLQGKDGKEREVQADLVVVNADLTYAHETLFRGRGGGKGTMREEKLAKKLKGKPHSCSSISFYWAMDRKIEGLEAHNIFLAEDYEGSFDDIFKRNGMPREPSFYVNVPSKIDPSAAPEGKDAMVVLVPVGHMLLEDSTQDWPSLVQRARRQLLEVMNGRLGIDVGSMIVWEEINTPVTWQEKFNLTHGSILGISHDFFNVLAFRHQARHPSVKGAYFVGASTHPGTGVPIAIAGSRLVTETILSDLDIAQPATYNRADTIPANPLDVKRPMPSQYRLAQFLILWAKITVAALALSYIGQQRGWHDALGISTGQLRVVALFGVMALMVTGRMATKSS